MRPRINKWKLTAGLVSAAGAAVLALGSLTAGAAAAPSGTFTSTSDGPQSTNVPYVAWVGEHVRLVACDPTITTDSGESVNFHLEDWSGNPNPAEIPESESGTQAFFAPSAGSEQANSGDGCVKIDYKSLVPGLGRIRAVVSNSAGAVVFSHQFLVIWLTVNKPTLSEVAAESGEPFVPASYLGDPSGNGEFVPTPFSEPETNSDKGLLQVKVTGSFPVEKDSALHNILNEESYTLPESWPTLAGKLATASEELEPEGTNPNLWDIHGSPGDSTETAAFGPFDPEATETLISNGVLNGDDAPMPAIRVDVHLAANEGGSSLGGVGQISGASKAAVYGGNGNPNPYYGAYIPATDRPVPQASGVDGPSPGGDFPAFLNKHPEAYKFWTSVHTSGERNAESTGCLQRTGRTGGEEDVDESSTYYETPSGSLNETFYTDERGEVLVQYTPGDGFYLNHIPVFGGAEGESEEGKIVKNNDGGCDLKNLYEKTIGESSINASVVYPYQSVDFGTEPSNTVVKKVSSRWEKEFFEFPKGNGKEEANVRIVVAKAQDIDGRPIADEKVCFHAQQEAGIYPFSNPTNGDKLADPGEELLGKGNGSEVDLSGSWVTDPQDVGTTSLCVTTNDKGLAAIDLIDSTFASVDLTARYENEEIVRDHLVEFPTNLGAKEKKAAEEKAAEEKVAAEEKAKAEKEAEKAEKEAEKKAAEKAQGEKEVAAEKAQHEREQAAEERQNKKEAEAEKRQSEKEAAKEAAEKKTAEEIAANTKARETVEAAEKTRRESEAAAEKARREAEVTKHEGEVKALVIPAAATPTPLVTPLAGALAVTPTGGKGKGGKKAHVAKHSKKGKKGSKKGGKKK
jgi:hypothetical protein